MIRGSLPRLLVVADRFTRPEISIRIKQLAAKGDMPWVQLRDHRVRRALFRGRGDVLIQNIQRVDDNSLVCVNSDLEFARNLGVGLHLGHRGPSVSSARETLGEKALIGFSAHSLQEAQRAADEGADYVTFSPVYPTNSKPGHPGVGLESLSEVCTALGKVPVFALGGITPERTAELQEAGAYGVAVLSGIIHARRPVVAARSFQSALAEVYP